jgi:hypothetical protein
MFRIELARYKYAVGGMINGCKSNLTTVNKLKEIKPKRNEGGK